MALPKRGSRVIVVEASTYRWMAAGNDGWIDLYVELDGVKGQQLQVKFDYHHTLLQMKDGVRLKQQFEVTPAIVRQAIMQGKKNGWKPNEKGKPLNLHHIDQQAGGKD